MKTKEMILMIAVVLLALMPAMAMAEWGISPAISANGRIDGAMANMSWSFGGGKSQGQEIVLAKNVSKQQPQRFAIVKQEAESQQFFSAEEMEKLVASIQLPPPVQGRKYLKIGAKPVAPKTFDFLKEDAYVLLKDTEVETVDNGGKISVGWLRAGEIVITEKGKTRVIRIWRCGNPVMSELYITAPKPAKVEAAPITAETVESSAKQESKKPDLFPQATIDKIADSGQSPAGNAKWTTGQKWLVGGLAVTAVAAVVYVVVQQNSHSKTTTTTTTTTTTGGSIGNDPPNGIGPGPNPPS